MFLDNFQFLFLESTVLISLRRIVWNEELLPVLAALCSPSWVSIGLLSIPILRPKKLSIITTVETLQDCRDWWDPWDLDYPQGLQNIVDLICGRLALAILVTFFSLVKVPMVIGHHSWGWHWRRRRSVSGVGEGGGWRPSRPPSNSPKPHHTPSPNIIQGRSLNCQLLANNYSTQIKLLIHFKYQSVCMSLFPLAADTFGFWRSNNEITNMTQKVNCQSL